MEHSTKKRNPVIAGLLSLLVMGLGQLYNTQLRKAIILYCVELIFIASGFILVAPLISWVGTMGVYALVAIYLAAKLCAVVDAVISARKSGPQDLQSFNKWYVYLTILCLTLGVQTLIGMPVESYRVTAGNMLPSYATGERILTNSHAYRSEGPKRGDVVVFERWDQRQKKSISRLVGLPKDRIQLIDGVLNINGEPVKLHQVDPSTNTGQAASANVTIWRETLPNGASYNIQDSGITAADNTPVFEVPEGSYFVLGDNRDNSLDSRFRPVGFVSKFDLVGRVDAKM